MPLGLKGDVAGYYYITNLGVNSSNMFYSPTDKDAFLQIINTIATTYKVIIHSHLLQDNYYNLLIETEQGNLNSFMNIVNRNYGYYLEQTYKQENKLWKSYYNSSYIENEKYLYVVLQQMKIIISGTPRIDF